MAHFWFLSAPLAGHLDWGGFLPTARALIDRGHRVTWLSEPSIAGAVEAGGVPFQPIAHSGWLWPPPPVPDLTTLKPMDAMFLRYRRALDTWLSEDLVAQAVEAIVAQADHTESDGKPDNRPDVIVSDSFLTAAAIAAEKLNVPFAVAGWPAGQPLDESRLYAIQTDLGRISIERLGRLFDRFGVRGVNFSGGIAASVQSPLLHLSYFSRGWYQAEADFLPQTQFVGGHTIAPKGDPPGWLAAIPPEAPLALITLGSTFTGDLGFFSWAAQAAARLGLIPIVVIGNNPFTPEQKAMLKAALPAGTRLLNWIDYAQVFPRLCVIIHHGGMATTHRALLHALPQIVVPHAADQRGQAERVAQAKVGLNLTAFDVQRGQLLPAIRAVIADPKVHAAAIAMQAELAALGGVDRAAELLIELALTKQEDHAKR